MKQDMNLTCIGLWYEDSVLTKIMMRKRQCLWTLLLAASFSLCMRPALVRGESYDLRTVKGIEAFSGSAAAGSMACIASNQSFYE